ncbi:hypothetical protein BC835DRAFT_1309401 [Cytidiella melzeri]|nr:hypothetical protein BC835DRAFT_1309401 [Cytidiella melzeri]
MQRPNRSDRRFPQRSYAHGSASRQTQPEVQASQGVITEFLPRPIVSHPLLQPASSTQANYAQASDSTLSSGLTSHHASNPQHLTVQHAPYGSSDQWNSSLNGVFRSFSMENVASNQHAADHAQYSYGGQDTEDLCFSSSHQLDFHYGATGATTQMFPTTFDANVTSAHNDVNSAGISTSSREHHGPTRVRTAQIPDSTNTLSSSTSAPSSVHSPREANIGTTSSVPTCNECRQKFKRIHDLQRHPASANVHGPRQWWCGMCGVSFGRKDSCLRHLESQHGCGRATFVSPSKDTVQGICCRSLSNAVHHEVVLIAQKYRLLATEYVSILRLRLLEMPSAVKKGQLEKSVATTNGENLQGIGL